MARSKQKGIEETNSGEPQCILWRGDIRFASAPADFFYFRATADMVGASALAGELVAASTYARVHAGELTGITRIGKLWN